MSKEELISKIFDILMSKELDAVDKLIDIYVLIRTERDAGVIILDPIVKKQDDIQEIDKFKDDVIDYKDLIDNMRNELSKEGKNDECLFDRYKQRNPGKYDNEPLMLYCPCKKCNPFTL